MSRLILFLCGGRDMRACISKKAVALGEKRIYMNLHLIHHFLETIHFAREYTLCSVAAGCLKSILTAVSLTHAALTNVFLFFDTWNFD